jgi:hypothetical protein
MCCKFLWFYYWQLLVKFQLEKYNFDLYKGFFMGKMLQICHITKEIFQIAKNIHKFMQIAKNTKVSLLLIKKIHV